MLLILSVVAVDNDFISVVGCPLNLYRFLQGERSSNEMPSFCLSFFLRYSVERRWSWVKSCCLPSKRPLASLGLCLTSRGTTHQQLDTRSLSLTVVVDHTGIWGRSVFLWFDTLKSSLVWDLMWASWKQALSMLLEHIEQRRFSFKWQSALVRLKLFALSSRITCQWLALKLNYHSKHKPKVSEYSDKVIGHSQPLFMHCDTLSRHCLLVWLLQTHTQKLKI